MRAGVIQELLRRFGRTVDLIPGGEGAALTVRAFVQPITDKNEAQYLPMAAGMRRTDRSLYLGPADTPVTAERGDCVVCAGERYRVESAQAIRVGEEITHWWAVLRPDEEGTWEEN